MNKTCKALLGILLALTMVVRILPMTALAEETVTTDHDVTLDKSYKRSPLQPTRAACQRTRAPSKPTMALWVSKTSLAIQIS